MKKRILAFLLAAVCAGAVMTGCGGGDTPSGGGATADEFDTPGGKRYSETVEITSVRSVGASLVFNEGDSIEDNIWTRTALEEYNIKLKYLWTSPDAQYAEKMSLMYSSGNLPDFLSVDVGAFETLYQEGQLKEIGTVADQYFSTYNKKLLNDIDGGAAQELVTKDGKRYGIAQPAGHEENSYIMWIRQDWLNTLGLDAPKTFDELTNVLKAFYENDPAGTGKKNYIPLGLSTTSWTGSINGLYNVLGAYKSIWLKKGDEYVYSSIQPEMKEALRQIANYYKLGYISPTYYNAQDSRIAELMGLNRMGVVFANYVSGIPIADGWAKNGANWVTYPMPAMTEAEYPAKSQISSDPSNFWVVTKNCKNPEAVIKLMNMFSDKVINDPIHYNTDENNVTIWHYMWPTIHPAMGNTQSYLKIREAEENGTTDKLTGTDLSNYQKGLAYENGSTDKMDWAMHAIFGKESALKTVYEYYVKPQNYIRDAWAKPNTPTMKEKEGELLNFEEESFKAIITGEKPIDYFDTFVAEWKRLGGEKMTQEVNAAMQQ